MSMDLYSGYSEVSQAVAQVDAADEQRHLIAHAPMVKRITRQLNSQVGGAMDREDMEQIGLMGLLDTRFVPLLNRPDIPSSR